MNNDLNSAVADDIKSYHLGSWLKAILINPSDIKLQNKIVNSNNNYAYNQLESLICKDIEQGELHPRVTSSTRALLNLPDSSYVAQNPYDYGMTLEELDSLYFRKEVQNDHERIVNLLMYFLTLNPPQVSFSSFDNSNEYKKLEKQLGNIKKYKKALEKYKSVSHFILASYKPNLDEEKAEVDIPNTNALLLTEPLMFFLSKAKCFQNRLLNLKNNKHTKINQCFLPEDFIKIPKDLMPHSLSAYWASPVLDDELKMHNQIFDDLAARLKRST